MVIYLEDNGNKKLFVIFKNQITTSLAFIFNDDHESLNLNSKYTIFYSMKTCFCCVSKNLLKYLKYIFLQIYNINY